MYIITSSKKTGKMVSIIWFYIAKYSKLHINPIIVWIILLHFYIIN